MEERRKLMQKPTRKQIFSRTADEAFNTALDTQLRTLALDLQRSVGKRCAGVILAGSYGRGEGACVLKNGRKSLYNDLNLFLVLKHQAGGSGRLDKRLKPVQEKWEERLGVDVDIGKPLLMRRISKLPHELMWYDLIHGHMVLSGPDDLISVRMPPWANEPLPDTEAVRLMLNRGSGLLQAIYYGLGSTLPPDADFVRRNYFKSLLAFGDALLIIVRSYTTELSVRLQRFSEAEGKLPGITHEEYIHIQGLYRDAVHFKESPDLFAAEADGEMLLETAGLWNRLFLYIEQRRTGNSWNDLHEYCMDDFLRETKQHKGSKLLRNLLKNAGRKKLSWKYPREILYRQLPLLLEEPKPWDRTWQEETERFLDLWHRVN